ncbi:isoprenyl transferase [Dongia sp.]|uniref:isoprenyl transferase n=1 Tax=Dongia sp. TaxID=1977262 RepID=UPI0035B1BCBE
MAEPVAAVSGNSQAAHGSSRPPRHIAIIMDGNGRWARARGLPRTVGHNSGAEAVRQAVKGAVACGVDYLTLFGFSSENWKRPTAEIDDLMGLLKLYLKREIEELHQNGVRMQVIGDRSRLGTDVVALIEAAEAKTAANKKLTLTIALSYGSRAEIVLAAKRLAEAVQRGELSPNQIDEARFERFLFTADMPDPDLLIRTSGEKRISNFLLWQCAYAEFVFLEKHWPDFGQDDLKSAIAEYLGRNRRYGASE